MIVLFVLFASLIVFRALGIVGVAAFHSWLTCARLALAVMFVFTATSHFTPMRRDLVAMVPPNFPRPDALVFITGVAELAGAIGLLIPATRYWAAMGLIVLLLAMLPANISAANRRVLLRGQPAMSLWLRIPMQALLIGWAWAVK